MKCKTENCRKTAKSGNYCYSCVVKKYKAAHPEKYAFIVLKGNAKRRGVVFGLTFEDFLKFAVKTDYMKNKGTASQSFHIDRIDERKGYFKSNIQTLTNRENVQKYLSYSLDEYGKPTGFKVHKKQTPEINSNLPF